MVRPRILDAQGREIGYVSRIEIGSGIDVSFDNTPRPATLHLSATGGGGGEHPDLATHNTLGLATQAELDAHEAAPDPHPDYALASDITGHVAAADPHTGYQRESEKGLANGYASLDGSGTVPDSQIPSTIARDSELPDLSGHVAAPDPHTQYALDSDLTAHAGAVDPHTGYVKENDANWTDLTDGGQTSLHSHAGGGGEAFPVGSVFIAVVSTDPATLLGYGTWSAIAAGRVLVGLDSGDTDFDTAEETGGGKTHTHASHSGVLSHSHTVTDPGHVHDQTVNSATTGGLSGYGARDTSTNTAAVTDYDTGSKVTGVTVDSAGSGTEYTHDSPEHLMPYFVVYMWKRTA